MRVNQIVSYKSNFYSLSQDISLYEMSENILFLLYRKRACIMAFQISILTTILIHIFFVVGVSLSFVVCDC
jgi:hypothetical protein